MRTSTASAPRRAQHREVLAEVTLQGENASDRRSHGGHRAARRRHSPRSCIRSSAGSVSMLMPTMASPRLPDTLAIFAGSL